MGRFDVVIGAYGLDDAVPLEHGPIGDHPAGPGIDSRLADDITATNDRSTHDNLRRRRCIGWTIW